MGFRQSDPRARSSSLDRALAEASAACSWDPPQIEAGRNAHLNGEIAKALGARANEWFATFPQVEKVEIFASIDAAPLDSA